MRTQEEIIIVGAGASGLMCGWLLCQMGKKVTILEKNLRPGKKLNATGNGSCNFTNKNLSGECYYGDSLFVDQVLQQFMAEQAIALFEELGIYHKERDGYCYPRNGQAATVVDFLNKACETCGVHMVFDTEVTGILHKGTGYELTERSGKKRVCQRLILATGGKANEPLGGTDRGYKLAESLRHTCSKLYPGLTGLKATGKEWKELAGVRMLGNVSLYANGRFVKSDRGEIQLVKDGISGIPVFQLCRLAAEALEQKEKVSCCIDFFPELTQTELAAWIHSHGTEHLEGLVHRKWVPVLTKQARNEAQLVKLMKSYEVEITDTFGMERAQVTAGGISTKEVDANTMESKKAPNLYLLGELLDVDGICGGYNLHFAWATAYLCSQAIKHKK